MIFYFDACGNISGAVKERIYQGTTDYNGIYFIAPFSTKSIIKARFGLPDASVTSDYELDLSLDGEKSNLYSQNSEKCNIWKGKIPHVATKLCGQVYVQFFILQPSGQTVSTASVSFCVEKGVKPIEREEVLSHAEILEKVLELSRLNENLEHAVRCAISETKMKEPLVEGIFASAYSVTYGANIKPFIKDKGVDNVAYSNGVFAFGSNAEKGVYYGYLPNKTYRTATLNYGNYKVYTLSFGQDETFLALGGGAYYSEDGKAYYPITIDGEDAMGYFCGTPLLACNLVVMAGVENKGVLYSENGKDFFTAISIEQSVNEIFISNGVLFVTTSGDNGGVFISFDGKTFTKKVDGGNFTAHASGAITALYGENSSIHTLDGERFVTADFNEKVKLTTYFNGGITAFSSVDGKVFRYEEGGNYSLVCTLDGVIKSLSVGNGKLVAITDLGCVYVSTNGAEFSKTEKTFMDLVDFKFIANKFVALTTTAVYYSENGLDFAVLDINGSFNTLQFIDERLFLVGNSGVYELNFTIKEKKNFKISKDNEPNSLVLRDENGSISGVQQKLVEGENIKIEGNVISAKVDVENLDISIDSVLSLDSDNPVEHKVITSALNEKGKTTVTVNSEEVATFNADTKLDKDTTTAIPTYIDGLIYGRDANGQKMIPCTTDTFAYALAMMDSAYRLRCRGNRSYPYTWETNIVVTNGVLEVLVIKPFKLKNGQTSGTIVPETASYNRYKDLSDSVALQLMLDGELYHQVSWDETNKIKTFRYIEDNIIKTITVNYSSSSNITWSLSVEDKSLYSHNIYITFTTDVGGNGNILLNIISNESDTYTATTLLQYLINEDLLNTDIQASGRYILSGGEGGAVTSFYSVDGTTLSISTIFSDGMVSANVIVTAITDKIVRLN